MEDIVHLGDNSQRAAIEVPLDLDCEFPSEFESEQPPPSFAPVPSRGGQRSRGRGSRGRSMSGSSQSEAPLAHKVRGPNWTEAEMLVLIAQNE